MGQKTNPKLFRLILNEGFLSNWYAEKQKYYTFFNEDLFLRKQIEIFFYDLLKISSISISRKQELSLNKVFIKVKALYPQENEVFKRISKILGEAPVQNSKHVFDNILQHKIENFLSLVTKKGIINCFFKISFIENQYQDAMLIAKEISSRIQKRIPFRRVIKDLLKKIMFSSVKGAKLQLSGRLNGIDIARTEWKSQGKIPLHTLSSDVDFAQHDTKTVHGIIGIKVWLHR